jgi:hypothetical protein
MKHYNFDEMGKKISEAIFVGEHAAGEEALLA